MSDEELIIKIRSGDKAAELELLKRYQIKVKKKASGFFLHGGDREDLEQVGMMAVCSAVQSFKEGGASFSSYASVCIENAVKDAIRKSVGAKQQALNNFVPIVEVVERAEYAVNPEDELIRLESRDEFLKKISKILSSFEFKITVMYLEGMSVGDISLPWENRKKAFQTRFAGQKTNLKRYICRRSKWLISHFTECFDPQPSTKLSGRNTL